MSPMIHCRVCGQLTDGAARFCESCGGQLGHARQDTLFEFGQPRTIVIGRDESCTFQIDKPTVSSQHALLEVTPGGHLRVRDLGSTNGVGINSPLNRIPEGFWEVHASDRLYLGRTEIVVEDVLQRTAQGSRVERSKAEYAAIKMRGTSMVFGRGPGVDFAVPHPMVSARHARLTREGNQYFIEDLGSTNGTFVAGRRVPPKTKVAVKTGDEVSFGSYGLVFDELGYVQRKATGNEITVTAENLAVCVPGESGMRELLGEVSLTIEPGDMVALMGPSGAGKTTFMCALNGITRPGGGRVLYRNLDLTENFDLFRTMIGYVPQDDIMHAQLTVYKALYYTAKLRLPADYTDEQIDARIRRVLADVGLADKIDEVIGDAVKKTLSGGQRKRVNLAMELLSEPWVLFLDEPTSGLSALDARSVIELLRKKLADQGRTIIVTIHQPSLDVYRQFNLLAMVSNHAPKPRAPRVPGRLVYFGPAMDAFAFFSSKGEGAAASESPKPEEIEAGLLQKPVAEWVKLYNNSSFRKIYVGDRKKLVAKTKTLAPPKPRKDRSRQLGVLCQRLAELKIRDKAQMGIALALPAVFGILVALSEKATLNTKEFQRFAEFSQKIGTAHFLMVVAAMWFGCNNAIREIVGERAIYRRERLVNLSLASYFGSKYVVLGALALMQCLMMLGIVHLGIGLRADFVQLLFTLWLTAIVGTGIGLCVSSVMQSNEQAIATLPLALLPMIVLGGCLTTVNAMSKHQPLGWLSDLAPTRWAYEANLVLENDALGSTAMLPYSATPEGQMEQVSADIKNAQEKARDRCLQAQAQMGQQIQKQVEAQANQTYQQVARGSNGRLPSQVKLSSTDLGIRIKPPSTNCDQFVDGSEIRAPISQSGHPKNKNPIDIAEAQFPSADGNVAAEVTRHTYNQSMARLGLMAVFWALSTLAMLKKDEWEWWQDIKLRLKVR